VLRERVILWDAISGNLNVELTLRKIFNRLGFFSFGATAPILALAYLHETLRFISVY
jgi:hypothetical protein